MSQLQAIQLRADIYNAPAIPTNITLPNGTLGLWQPTVLTLISGPTEAVLVDTLFTHDQGVQVADWLDEILGNKTLKSIYVTHGHGDHWFNVPYLKTRFPDVAAVSTQHSIDHMAGQISPDGRAFWDELFPGQIDNSSFDSSIPVALLLDNRFVIEGHTFEATDVGHSDTDNTTFLYVPALDLAVTGDVVYNDVHLWMVESPSQVLRDGWVRSLDKLEAFGAGLVVASHHRLGGLDGAFNIEATREYITTFGRLVESSKNATELYGKVLLAYPQRLGLAAFWLSCMAQFES